MASIAVLFLVLNGFSRCAETSEASIRGSSNSSGKGRGRTSGASGHFDDDDMTSFRNSTKNSLGDSGIDARTTLADIGSAQGLPTWCRWVPADFELEACRAAGCQCQSWCDASPTISWEWNPQCCACNSESTGNEPNTHGDDAGTELGAASFGLQFPTWCRSVPHHIQEDACRNRFEGCKCRRWCASTPSVSREWNPQCCGCTPASIGNQLDRTGLDVGLVLATVARDPRFPTWCRWVPESFREVACRGSSKGCKCQSWCDDWPAVFWEWNPECCACGVQDSRNQVRRDDLNVPMSVAAVGLEEHFPTWCRWVPEKFRENACHGSSTACSCQSWCDSTPAVSQEFNPKCCGCIPSGVHDQSDRDVDNAGAVPPEASLSEAFPAWCRWVPLDFPEDACNSQSDGCACESWCEATANISREWNPGCCGCSAANFSTPGRSPGLLGATDHHMSAELASSGQGGPAWCHLLPPAIKANCTHCTANGCKCASWCGSSPLGTWQWNPACCSCDLTGTSKAGGRTGLWMSWTAPIALLVVVAQLEW
mmetsp:Transcript_95114/g.248117  ORF Transcript_95114/g.248117 Transcript_95114/m.248117 type:complete len:539 (-) Transcript_95114:62-1678(-)